MKQSNFKSVEFMRKTREELSKLYFKNKKEFIDKINKNSINPVKNLKPSNFSQKNKVSEVSHNT